MGQLRLGVIGATHKENERRLPIHPHHLNRIDADVRNVRNSNQEIRAVIEC